MTALPCKLDMATEAAGWNHTWFPWHTPLAGRGSPPVLHPCHMPWFWRRSRFSQIPWLPREPVGINWVTSKGSPSTFYIIFMELNGVLLLFILTGMSAQLAKLQAVVLALNDLANNHLHLCIFTDYVSLSIVWLTGPTTGWNNNSLHKIYTLGKESWESLAS